ncbi:polycystin-2-like [Watersipora subatra]|uniref:polycystin-2-like n=1 Tax=Watersipora subatra TaxID=2589382 RepID=UPI00355C49B1
MADRPSSSDDKRPGSGSSRSAWNDDGLDAPGRPESGSSGGSSSVSKRDAKSAKSVSSSGERRKKVKKVKKQNLCSRIINSIWSTRHTQELVDNEEKARTVIRELIIYVIFLSITIAITAGMMHKNMYTMTKVMTDLMIDSQFYDTKNSFGGMLTQTDFWRFAEGPMLDGLYWEKYYNGDNVSDSELGYVYYESKLLGVPRLRQLRVTNSSCKIAGAFKDVIPECYGSWSPSTNDESSFGPGIDSAWEFHDKKAMNGSSHKGTLATYPGSGFYQDLSTTRAKTKAIIEVLKENRWINRGTRVVFLDFTIYNPNVNLFCVAKLIVEYPPSGGALSSQKFTTVKLLRYVTVSDYIIMGCEFVFIAYIIYYLIEELIEMKNEGCGKYFTEFWNWMDVLVIIIAIVCICFNFYRTITVEKVLERLLSAPDEFADFESLGYWQMQFNYGVALTAFFSWGKLFKYISFNKTMTQLTDTMSQAKKDLASFAIMFFIVFFAFAQVGYLLFGTQVNDFRSIADVLLTQLRIILGDFNFYELEATHPILGPLYFIIYIVFVFFILFNMFLAIINDTYSSVKEASAEKTNEFEVMDFFKGQYNKLLEKLNIKRDRIADIQDALAAADTNQDSLIEYDEWKEELLGRGYKEDEIEEAFKKFDKDGNKVLDADEQALMLKALEDEKNAVNANIGKVEHKLGVNERAKSSRPGTRARTSRGGRRGKKSAQEESEPDKPPTSGENNPRVVSEVGYGEFSQLSRRVDRMEHSIGSIVSKIDTVLVKLEGMEKAKLKRREAMTQLLDSIAASEEESEEAKREQMERLVREELERWDSETAVSRPGTSMSRPGTSASRPRTGMR